MRCLLQSLCSAVTSYGQEKYYFFLSIRCCSRTILNHFSFNRIFVLLLHDADMHSAYLLWQHGWLAGCLSHAGIVSKLFWPSGSHIILVSSDLCADTQFQGEPLQWGYLIHGVEKIGNFRAIFDGNLRLSRKWCEIGRWLLWNINRKSWVPDWMV